MLISSRGRYALRVIIDLAEHDKNEYIPMKDVADRQRISLKYLERILPVLTKNRYIEGIHGRGGGYRLAKDPADIKVGDVLRLTEGDLAPVTCLECTTEPCTHTAECRAYPMWKDFEKLINDFFDGRTIADLMR